MCLINIKLPQHITSIIDKIFEVFGGNVWNVLEIVFTVRNKFIEKIIISIPQNLSCMFSIGNGIVMLLSFTEYSAGFSVRF